MTSGHGLATQELPISGSNNWRGSQTLSSQFKLAEEKGLVEVSVENTSIVKQPLSVAVFINLSLSNLLLVTIVFKRHAQEKLDVL